MEKSNKLVFFGLIIGLSLILSAGLVAKTFLDVKNLENVISVSGSAKQKVSSDSARWTGNFSRIAARDNLKDGYSQMKNDEKTVGDFLIAQGFQNSFEMIERRKYALTSNHSNISSKISLGRTFIGIECATTLL